jgi:hypothetical protein
MTNITTPIRSGYILALLLTIGILASCGRCKQDTMSDYIQTVKSGLDTLPWPKEMEALFGEGDHFVTHYGFSPGPKKWNTEIFFGGRYTLTLQVDVDIDYKGHTIRSNVAPAKFYLWEVGALIRGARGVEGADIAGQWIFDEAKWKRLVQAKGDWSAIGIPVNTNSPIEGFDDYVKGCRSPRVNIPH